MKKMLKLFFILVIMIAFSMNLSVFAVEEQEAVASEPETSVTSPAPETTQTTTTTSETKKATDNNATKVSSTTEEKSLSISDILNILLIATGIVIILFQIPRIQFTAPRNS